MHAPESRRAPYRVTLTLRHALLCVIGVLSCFMGYEAIAGQEPGNNPHPVHLNIPPAAPLTSVALLGKKLFFDPMLSASGRQACASCHSPEHHYGPPDASAVQLGGRQLQSQGFRAVPALTYLHQQPPFTIGPDLESVSGAANLHAVANVHAVTASAQSGARASKQAGVAPAVPALVPQGGLFWDGRADSMQQQALGPLLNPVEMANADANEVASKLIHSAYRESFVQLFGPQILDDPQRLVMEAMFAIGRFEIEDVSFHPFTSKYDAWLQGKAPLTIEEIRGFALFNDPKKANCAACHLSQVNADGSPPLFTDTQYEALAVPRNSTLTSNQDPHFFDLGVCGPFRVDVAKQTQYCGMFLTPTLRNVGQRSVFFHNGVYHTLKQVVDFYNLRSVAPEKIYPRDANGKLEMYDDIPEAYWANVDTTDAPFDGRPGSQPVLSDQDVRDIIAFLHTLDDGYLTSTPSKPQTN